MKRVDKPVHMPRALFGGDPGAMPDRLCETCRHWEPWEPIGEPLKGTCQAAQLVDNLRGPESAATDFVVAFTPSGDESSELVCGPKHGCRKWKGTEEHLNKSDPSRAPRLRIHDELTKRDLKVGISTYGYPWDVGYHQVNFLETWGQRRYWVCWLRLEDGDMTATINLPRGDDDEDKPKPVTFDWVAEEYHKLRAEIVAKYGEPDD